AAHGAAWPCRSELRVPHLRSAHPAGDAFEVHLRQRCVEACALLGWQPPYADRVAAETRGSSQAPRGRFDAQR
ncbi:MAG: hypothetical protein JSW68_10925, partial [Burkholderiales bacterium]